MSTQRKPNLAAYRTNVQNWFHEDDGTVSSTGLPPARPKKSFEDEVSFLSDTYQPGNLSLSSLSCFALIFLLGILDCHFLLSESSATSNFGLTLQIGFFFSPPQFSLHIHLQDLTELMYPAGDGPRPAVAAPNPGQPHNIRRQTTDNARLRTPHGAAAFVLEEPIVPTQRMVHAGPRRYALHKTLPFAMCAKS